MPVRAAGWPHDNPAAVGGYEVATKLLGNSSRGASTATLNPEAPTDGERGTVYAEIPAHLIGGAIVENSPPQLPPAGWYADPKGEAPLRWWDGHQWTSETDDLIPAAMKQHQCVFEVGAERARAVLVVRSWRLILAELRGDADTTDQILMEMDDCPVCLQSVARLLLAAFKSSAFAAARGSQEAQAQVIPGIEKLLARAVDAARPMM